MPNLVAAIVAVAEPEPMTIGGQAFVFGPARGVSGDVDGYARLLALGGHGGSLSLTILTDDKSTRVKALMSKLHELVAQVGPRGTFVLALIGHGFQVPALGGDEPDGRDEVFAAKDGPVTDNQFRELWKNLDPTATVVSFVDTCHSDSLSISFAPQNEHISTGVHGPYRLALAASKEGEDAVSVETENGEYRGAWSLALENAWNSGQTYLDWFREAALMMEERKMAQTPQLRYLGQDDAILHCVPFLGADD